MFVIVQRIEGRKGKTRKWLTFPSENERNTAFERMKTEASKSGCGGQCGCFWNGGDMFYHCGNWVTEKLANLKLANEV